MATILGRTILKHTRTPIIYQAIRGNKKRINDQLIHATGVERREMLAILNGYDDPFCMKALKLGPGTKDEPNLVPSLFDSRMIGCMCEDESLTINWMWVHKDHPRRCGCGYWFKLVPRPEMIIEEDVTKLVPGFKYDD